MEHSGSQDWAVNRSVMLETAPGDIFEMTAWVRGDGEGSFTIGAALYGPDKKVLNWILGAKTVPGGTFGGMKAYVDPESGELTDTPPPGADPLPGDVHVPAGTARPSPVPGGGLMLEDEPKGRD
ncbi:MAG: hypothetical protein D6815_02580 [Candidatus Dadabacteria bacterium]|nr:MAG: hypothetical protein D6815_02580 [Candidatus Dadabacteria bacterium]